MDRKVAEMTDQPIRKGGKLTRYQLVYVVFCAILAMSTGVVGYIAVDTAQLANDTAQESHKAQCLSKVALQESVASANEFLEHPEEFPDFNSPAIIKLTEAKVLSEEARLHALRDVDCT